jgi:adenosylcobinamide-phosphate synthase
MISLFTSSPFILHPLIFVPSFLLDFLLGDPHWLPHPVRIIGAAISKSETLLRRRVTTSRAEKLGGIVLVLLIVLPVFCITFILNMIIYRSFDSSFPSLAGFLGAAFLVYLTFTTIAARGLISAGRAVIGLIKEKDIVSARKSLSMIVGRDTERLSEKEILKATIETLSENLSDGVIAPVFYLVLGGLPLAMVYKAINTLDSMVGYKNERYRNFGWAAARLDDIANYVPARITGLFIVLSSAIFSGSLKTALNSFRTMLRDGRNHSSPNSGVPEAAMAGAIGVMLGGPSFYGGVLVEERWIGQDRQGNYMIASEQATAIAIITSFVSLGIAALVLYMRSSL